MENPDSYSEKVLELMNNEDISEVTVIDPTIVEEEKIDDISNLTKENEIMPLGGTTYYKYRVTNVKNGSDYTGTSKIATVSGTPGMTISISKTKTVKQSKEHIPWTDYVSGYSRKTYGISFRKTYTYK